MQQPKERKASRSLYDDLNKSGLLGGADFSEFYTQFSTNPEYQTAIHSHYKNEGYEMPDVSDWVEQYRVKDAISYAQPIIEGDPSGNPARGFSASVEPQSQADQRTIDNLDRLANPVLGPPTVSGGTKRNIDNLVAEARDVEEALSTDQINEAEARLLEERKERFDESFFDMNAARAGEQIENPPTGEGVAASVEIPDLPQADNPDGDVMRLIDFDSPEFNVVVVGSGQFEELRNKVSMDVANKPFTELGLSEKAAINKIVARRYVPQEVGENIIVNMGYERDSGALHTFGSNFLRSFQGTFANAAGGMAQQAMTNMNKGFVSMPGGVVAPVYAPDVQGRDAGEIRKSIASDVQKYEEELAKRLTVDPTQNGFFTTDVAQGFGSAGAFVASGILTRGASGIGASMMGAQSMKMQGYREAIESGATEDEANQVAGLFGIIGASEGLPIMHMMNKFGKVARASGKVSPMSIVAKNMGTQGIEESFQEGLSGFMQGLTINELLDLNKELIDEGLFREMGTGGVVGTVLAIPGGTMSAYTSIAERRAEGASEAQRQALLAQVEEMKAQYVSVVAKKRDESLASIDQEIARVKESIAGIPEDSNAPVAKRAQRDLEELEGLRYDLDNSLTDIADHNAMVIGVDKSQVVDPAEEIGLYTRAAENLIKRVQREMELAGSPSRQPAATTQEAIEPKVAKPSPAPQVEEAMRREQNELLGDLTAKELYDSSKEIFSEETLKSMEDSGGGNATEAATSAGILRSIVSERLEAASLDPQNSEIAEELLSEVTRINKGQTTRAEPGVAATESQNEEVITAPESATTDIGQAKPKEAAVPKPAPRSASEEDVVLIDRAEKEGEDSSYKGERNKVRRVIGPDGKVEYAVKEGVKSTSIIRENEAGELVSKNLSTGKETVLGEKSAIRKAYYRNLGEKVAKPATVAQAETTAQEVEGAPQVDSTPVATIAPETQTEATVEAEPEEQAPVKTLEERAKIKSNQKRFVEQIPESVRSRILTDLAGDTKPEKFGEFLKSLPKEEQEAYRKRLRSGSNPILIKHNTAARKGRATALKGSEKKRRNQQTQVHDEVITSKVGERAREKLSNIPKQLILQAEAAVKEFALENRGATRSEVDAVFRDSLGGRLSEFVDWLKGELMNLESVSSNAEEMGFLNPADFATHIAERMLLSGGADKTGFATDAKGRIRIKDLVSAAEVIQQESAENSQGSFSKIKVKARQGTLKVDVEKPSTEGQVAQRPQVIMSGLRTALGARVNFRIVPGAYGYFNRKTKQIYITFKSDLNTFAHEVAHYIDDKFDITNGVLSSKVLGQLDAFAKTSPDYNPDNVLSETNLQEGFAIFIENYVLNPSDTSEVAPDLAALYNDSVNEETSSEVLAFSEAFRTYYHNDSLSTDASNIHSLASSNVDPASEQSKSRKKAGAEKRQKTGLGTRTKEERERVGEFDTRRLIFKMSSAIDMIPRILTEGMVTTMRTWKKLYTAMGYNPNDVIEKDGRKVLPMQALDFAISKYLGRGGQTEQAIAFGLANPAAEAENGVMARYKDEDGNDISYAYAMGAFDNSSPDSLKSDQDKTAAALVNERVVEITARNIFGSKEVRDKLKEVGLDKDIMEDENMSILDKALRIREAVNRYNLANPDSAIDMPVVSGQGVYDKSDLDGAIQQLSAEEALQRGNESQKLQWERIQEGKKRYRAVADMMLQYMRDTGRITDEDYQKIKDGNRYYAAMQRVFGLTPSLEDQRSGKSFTGNYGLTRVDQPIAKAKGSGQEIRDPYQSLFENIGRIISESARNEIIGTFAGSFADAISTTLDSQLASDALGIVDEVTAFVQTDDGGQSFFNGKLVTHNDAMADGKIVQLAYIKGQPRWFLVDRIIADELQTMYNIGLGDNIFGNVVRGAVRVWKKMITAFPGFIVKNAIRDIPSTAIISEVPGQMGLDGWSGAFDEQIRRDFEASGASQAGHFVRHVASYEATQKFIWEQMTSNEDGNVNWAVFRPASTRIGELMDSSVVGKKVREARNLVTNRVYQESEEFNRRREYSRAFNHARNNLGLDTYMASRYAATKARGILDYTRGDRLSLLLNQFMPFYNARMQGIRKFGDLLATARTEPERFQVSAIRFMTLVVLPTMAQMAAMGAADDEEGNLMNMYANLPAWQRYYFWNFKAGADNWVSIPKPFDFGVVGTGIESLMLRMITGDDRFTEGLSHEVFKAFSPMTSEQVLGAGGPLRLLWEVPANYKSFYGSNIYPANEKGLAPSLQSSTERATDIGRGIQAGFKAFGYDVNAKAADYAFESLFGSWGRFAIRTSKDGDGLGMLKNMFGIFRSNPSFNAQDYQDFMSLVKYADLRNVEPFRSEISMVQEMMSAAISTDDPERSEALLNAVLGKDGIVASKAAIWRDPEQRERVVEWRKYMKQINKRD